MGRQHNGYHVYWSPLSKESDTGSARLHMNENLFLPDAESATYSYDGRHGPLVEALAEYHGVGASNILIGAGSSAILSGCFMAFGIGRRIVLPRPGWGFYYYLASLVSSDVCSYELQPPQFEQTAAAIADWCDQPSLVVVTKPHMPCGSSLSIEDLELLAGRAPSSIILLDEAYWGFTQPTPIAGLLERYPNVLSIRTFSKLFGLARDRVGFVLGNAGHIDRIGPAVSLLGVSEQAQKRAIDALHNSEYYIAVGSRVAAERGWFGSRMRTLGFSVPESSGNYLLIGSDAATTKSIYEACAGEGISVRECGSYGLEGYLRITIGPRPVMERVLAIATWARDAQACTTVRLTRETAAFSPIVGDR